MKRAGKCVNKKAYRYKFVAINTASKFFKRDGIEFGVYECPTCLDFHLTSKYCNLKEFHLRWLRSHINKQYLEFLELEKKLCPDSEKKRIATRRKRANRRRNKQLREQPKNPNIISDEQQKEIFKNFQPKIYTQPSWWRRVLNMVNYKQHGS